MTFLYFACTECKIFIEAGSRWAQITLGVPGIVRRGAVVPVDRVLSATQYWNPPKQEGSRWLYEGVLPAARAFLENHGLHRIVFGLYEEVVAADADEELDWLEVGYQPQPLPRYYAEVLRLSEWEEVVGQVMESGRDPWWMISGSGWVERARARFEELVRSRDAS